MPRWACFNTTRKRRWHNHNGIGTTARSWQHWPQHHDHDNDKGDSGWRLATIATAAINTPTAMIATTTQELKLQRWRRQHDSIGHDNAGTTTDNDEGDSGWQLATIATAAINTPTTTIAMTTQELKLRRLRRRRPGQQWRRQHNGISHDNTGATTNNDKGNGSSCRSATTPTMTTTTTNNARAQDAMTTTTTAWTTMVTTTQSLQHLALSCASLFFSVDNPL
ncbi:hypothetical protein EDB89DRAFT_1911515 [Lactarius sanguifluus]|nr:hypothetical protein EDB89DRAFT_1911515 [Lactarius sanguifluus]